MTRVWLLVVSVGMLVACSKDKEAAPPAPAITYQEAPKVGERAQAEAAAAEVAVPEDFDDESEAQISVENFRAELDRLEAEIAADKAQ